MEEKVTYSTREIVAGKILKQLDAMSQKDKKQLLMRLLEHVEPTFIAALQFAYEMAPTQEQEKE